MSASGRQENVWSVRLEHKSGCSFSCLAKVRFRPIADIPIGAFGPLVPTLYPRHACVSQNLGETFLELQRLPLVKRVQMFNKLG
jgi:hypothetical protein